MSTKDVVEEETKFGLKSCENGEKMCGKWQHNDKKLVNFNFFYIWKKIKVSWEKKAHRLNIFFKVPPYN